MPLRCALAIALCWLPVAASRSCYIPATELLGEGVPIPSLSITTTPYQRWLESPYQVPDTIDWRNVTQPVFNQMLPSQCGSCWAFGSTGALADRIAIASGGLGFAVSPQALLDCATANNRGAVVAGSCNGGSHELAYAFATTTGLTDQTCLPYVGMDGSNWGESPCADRLCKKCDRFGSCSYQPANQTLAVKVVEHGSIRGVEAMKIEIAERGPIACSMYAHADAFEAYTGGIIKDTTKYPGTTHVVNVVGFGVTSDHTSYWIVRNSFGTSWGELGYYRVQIGLDIYNMESHNCSWAVPDPRFISELRKRSGRPSAD